MVYLYFRCWC